MWHREKCQSIGKFIIQLLLNWMQWLFWHLSWFEHDKLSFEIEIFASVFIMIKILFISGRKFYKHMRVCGGKFGKNALWILFRFFFLNFLYGRIGFLKYLGILLEGSNTALLLFVAFEPRLLSVAFEPRLFGDLPISAVCPWLKILCCVDSSKGTCF